MSERWLPVVGWEGRYEVSDFGRVRSVERCGIHGREGNHVFPSRILNPIANQKGYSVVNFTDNATPGTTRRRAQRLVHQLVLEAFVGPRPDGFDSCHNNGNKADARLKNLRWDTRAGNFADKKLHGTSQTGARNGNSREARLRRAMRV